MIRHVEEIDDELTPENYCDEHRMQQLMAKDRPAGYKPKTLDEVMARHGFKPKIDGEVAKLEAQASDDA
jgi:hypothetical protein